MNSLKRLAIIGLSQSVHIPTSSRFIFTYHDVSDVKADHHSPHYSTPTERFYEHIEWLAKYFEFVSLDCIVTHQASKNRLATITFDDGFLSVKEIAMPYLLAREIPFAVFVNQTAMRENYLPYDLFPEINRRHQSKVYLDENDVRELYEKGVTIGSHTTNHTVLSECDLEMLQAEVAENKFYLEKLLGEQVTHFAIPYGKKEHYNTHALEFCRSVGHEFLYNTNPVYFSCSELNELLLIPRLGLTAQSRADLLFLINRPMVKRLSI